MKDIYLIHEIDYDTSDSGFKPEVDPPALPQTMTFSVPAGTEEEEVFGMASDKISNNTGFCVNSFNIMRLKNIA